ncbi:MAG: hypothetical protein FWG64_03160, partial [Firmicutes bacterium]|nr:hypothetical protein [Bacillota bacterium]
YGELILPIGTITQIITSVVGLLDVENRLPHIAGRLLENDIGLRKSYIDKIYLRSANMVESIESAIWQNVQGVQSVRGFQNDTHLWDEYGRPPHSVELVVMGGSNRQIAQQIWQAKAAGIQTHGNVESFVTANENETVLIKFTRPQPVYIWYKIELTLDNTQILPPNYVQAIQETITERLQTAKPGQNISSQRLFVHHLHEKIPGIAYIATSHFATTDINVGEIVLDRPYSSGLVEITPRQLAVTEPSKIEVLING